MQKRRSKIPSPKGNNKIMSLPVTPKKKIGRGRPKKIPFSASIDSMSQQESLTTITTQKRGRGRPRKYPPNPQSKDYPTKLGQIPDLVGLMKNPGMASVWGSAQKGKRVNLKRKENGLDLGFPSTKESASPSSTELRKENGEDLGFPSTKESASLSSTESNSNSNSNSYSNFNSKSDYSWFSNIVIPGPIPDLDELLMDQSIFRHSDFFSGIPDDWESFFPGSLK